MRTIIEMLGLPETATEAQVLGVITSQRSALLDAQELVKRVTAAGNLPDGLDAVALGKKIAAGLDRGQALEVMLSQAAHDKTNPHDKPSKEANSAANKGIKEGGFDKMSKEELFDECAKRNLDVDSKATKAELLEALKGGSGAAV